MYECMNLLEDRVEDMNKRDEADEFAKVVRSSMEVWTSFFTLFFSTHFEQKQLN